MSYKRSIDELDFEASAPTLAKRKLEAMSDQTPEPMLTAPLDQTNGPETSGQVVADSDSEDECDTDPDIIMPYLNRFRESYESSLEIYTSRLDKLELSDALKCTNDLFAVAIDNYSKEHNGFAHNTQMDLSGVHNVRREFDQLIDGHHRSDADHSSYHCHSGQGSGQQCSGQQCSGQQCSSQQCSGQQCSGQQSSPQSSSPQSSGSTPHSQTSYCLSSDEKLSKVLQVMTEIEAKICLDMRSIYESYERLLSSLVVIEYRLAVIIEMFHHMTSVEPQKFLPSLPYVQNVPDLIGYINSLYDQELEVSLKDETNSLRMQAIVSQFRAMHKRIRDAMDGLHALSCIIMEKKTEVIDRVHTFYKKAEQIFFAEPSYVFQTKDTDSRCL